MAYASYSLAVLFTSPVRRRGLDVQLADTPKTRTSLATWALATCTYVFAMVLGVQLDPKTGRSS